VLRTRAPQLGAGPREPRSTSGCRRIDRLQAPLDRRTFGDQRLGIAFESGRVKRVRLGGALCDAPRLGGGAGEARTAGRCDQRRIERGEKR
jgi:hypothetical protein